MEEAFKDSNGTKKKEYRSCESSTDNSDEEEKNFIRKLKKGSRKYKGKLHFKCFDCGRIGNFASKCSYPKGEDNDYEKDYNHREYKNK